MESSNDNIWESLREEAEQAGKNERLLVAYLEETIQGQNPLIRLSVIPWPRNFVMISCRG